MKNRLVTFYIALLMLCSFQSISAPVEIVSGSINVGDLDVTLQAGYRGSTVNSSVLFADAFSVIEPGVSGVENRAVADSESSVTISESGIRVDATNNPGIFFRALMAVH
ncbi:hypothetical protein MNBD_GAMMA11-161 [hydrothermal vent metagenome]|uniref:Uncharacterized protein n=1 Tax=hydrothermal vent metagenome TaxID=652676 RepID=A0A3B0WQZ5_9ZZZZ